MAVLSLEKLKFPITQELPSLVWLGCNYCLAILSPVRKTSLAEKKQGIDDALMQLYST